MWLGYFRMIQQINTWFGTNLQKGKRRWWDKFQNFLSNEKYLNCFAKIAACSLGCFDPELYAKPRADGSSVVSLPVVSHVCFFPPPNVRWFCCEFRKAKSLQMMMKMVCLVAQMLQSQWLLWLGGAGIQASSSLICFLKSKCTYIILVEMHASEKGETN